MRIVIVEDEHEMVNHIREVLEERFKDPACEVVRTEEGFRAMLPQLRKCPPELFIIDVMLPWTRPSADMTPMPPEVKAGGFARAGLRCVDAARKAGLTTPIVLYTALDRDDVVPAALPVLDVFYASKDANGRNLMKQVAEALLPRSR